jgi:hypothetical protein
MALRKAMEDDLNKKWLTVLKHLIQLFGKADEIALIAMWGLE